MAKEYGREGSVIHEAYCMPSEHKQNVDSINAKMGYHDLSDLANTKSYPSQMGRERKNIQLDPKMPSKRY